MATTVGLLWRTRLPVLTAGLLLGADLVQGLLAHPSGSIWSLIALILAMYSIAAGYREGTAALIGLGFIGVLLIEERIDNGPDYLFIAVVFGGTWLLGRASRLWRGRVTRAEREREHLAALAAAEERVRIARELHDILGHTLGMITVQAEAADAALDRDPSRAREPVRAIAENARRSLHEIRDVLHLVRDDGLDTVTSGIDGIRTLVADAERAGVDVALDTVDAEGVPSVVQRAAYRIVQEAMANAVKHAPGSAVRVRLERGPDELVVEVVNGLGRPAPASRDGAGLAGIRERADALRGTLEAAPYQGGFRVRVRFPLTNEEPA
ncbi:sensor histidine kinase [Pseudolysinimonas kribbensis]|uniref:sensor histidine kinase n=1 Tax=Pseudolysinimonas kribbensis TaxID=433641 RepID=UPI0024E0B126|nr:histidine kinase [Pseudolysinimonas kribbensis]